MSVRLDLLSCPADPTVAAAYEDSCVLDDNHGVIAIADGAGTSFDPKAWADALCDALVDVARRGTPQELQEAWRLAIYMWTRRPNRAPLAPGLDLKNSAATLGILVVQPPRWSFSCVGDINVIQADADGAAWTTPALQRGRDYNSAPHLLPDASSEVDVITTSGTCKAGDVLFVFTDGIGPWLVDNANAETIKRLRDMKQTDFEDFMEGLRTHSGVRADDATVGRCIIGRS